MKLLKSKENDLLEIMTWLNSQEEARIWGGPAIKFPLNIEALKDQINWNTFNSYSFFDSSKLVGFAQTSKKEKYTHISRVLIKPSERGKKLGKKLMESIIDISNVTNSKLSLFVYSQNHKAISLYEKLGFFVLEEDTSPRMEGSVFMVRDMN